MADHFNKYHLKHFAGIIADCMEIPLPGEYAPGVKWVSKILKDRLGGKAERAILYHADAVGMHMWQKYTDLFAPVHKHTSLALPFCSTLEPVTPVAHASMYTGLTPEEHGIKDIRSSAASLQYSLRRDDKGRSAHSHSGSGGFLISAFIQRAGYKII